MKTKILPLIIISTFIVSFSNAQIKGQYMLGGSASYSNSDNTSQGYGGYVQVGKVIQNNLVFGIMGGYSVNENRLDSTKNHTNQVSLGVFVRKYKNISSKFLFFLQPDATYNSLKNVIQSRTRNTSENFSVGVTPGLSFIVSKCFQMEITMPDPISVSYSATTFYDYSQQTTTSKSHSFAVSANFSEILLSNFGIGIKFFLGKNKS